MCMLNFVAAVYICRNSACKHLDLERFYRATHMHSAVYVMVRCLSVCPYVTLVYCVETTELIIKHHHQRSS